VGYDIQGDQEEEDSSYNFNPKPNAGKRGSRGVGNGINAGEENSQKKYLPTASRGGNREDHD
jgi:hypothetical protein